VWAGEAPVPSLFHTGHGKHVEPAEIWPTPTLTAGTFGDAGLHRWFPQPKTTNRHLISA